MTFSTSCNTSSQLSVAPHFRERVLALYLAVMQGGGALGAPLTGWIGTTFGARWTLAGGGVVVMLSALIAVLIVSRTNQLPMREQLRSALRVRRTQAPGKFELQ